MLPDATVRYADRDDAVIDLHLPHGRPTGSSYSCTAGSGRPSGTDGTLARWRGPWRMQAVSSRRRSTAACGNGGGWPVTADDVHLATSRLPELLEGLGIAAPDPLVVTGHSAGGHLALWLATTGLPIRRVVALAPVCDLREAMRLGLGANATQALLGGTDPSVADPMTLLDERPGCPIAIVHGVDDDEVPVSLSRGLVERHPWVELHEVPAGHYEPIEPSSGAWPMVTACSGLPAYELAHPGDR